MCTYSSRPWKSRIRRYAAAAMLFVVAGTSGAHPSAFAVSVLVPVQITIRGGITMSIETMSNPAVMRELISEFGDVLPPEVSRNPAYVAKLSFGPLNGAAPLVTLAQVSLAFRDDENQQIEATTFAMNQTVESGQISFVGAFIPDSSRPAAGTYRAIATVQVLFQ